MLTNHERQKLVEAVLYFATNVKKLGKVKLFKLLYFLDFEHFRDTGRSVTGMDYVAWKMGPVPEVLYSELSALDTAAGEWFGKVEFGSRETKNGPMLAVRRVRTVVLPVQIAVEASQLFPFDDGQHGIERIQICDLNVRSVHAPLRDAGATHR